MHLNIIVRWNQSGIERSSVMVAVLLWSFKYKCHIKIYRSLPTVSSLALKALEIVSASKQKIYVRSQKQLNLDLDPGTGPWKTCTLKNLDAEKPGLWKTLTLKKLDPEMHESWKTWKNMSDFRELCSIKTMRNVVYKT